MNSATVSKAKEVAVKATDRVKETSTQLVSEKKGEAADKMEGYSSSLRNSARAAEDQGDANIAHFVDGAADRLEQVANYVRNSDLQVLQRDVASVARRHPALFFGGMLVAGLVLGNLAKASVQSLSEEQDPEGDATDDAHANAAAAFGNSPEAARAGDEGGELRGSDRSSAIHEPVL